jgi:choline monooxygenase
VSEHDSLDQIVSRYRADTPLAQASTIPAAWYIDPRVLELEYRTVFRRSWQVAGRIDELETPGDYITCELPGGEPIVVVHGADHVVRAFFNVCRHHAAAVVTAPQGCAQQFRCPYHGWTYGLDGALKGTPDFAEVCDFDRSSHGLVPLPCEVAEKWVFVSPEPDGVTLNEFLGTALTADLAERGFATLHWQERQHFAVDCNWKVFVDNYLDGGYHVPHVHRGLDSVLSSREYTIETGERFCLQWSPMVTDGAEARTGAVRQGDRAFYYWLYPNFMINCYGRTMDTNLVIPRGVDKAEVIFDFYFADVSEQAREQNRASIAVSQEIQEEDVGVCASVQRGLRSRAYDTGRLSVRREAGEHLFHRLLHADLTSGLR